MSRLCHRTARWVRLLPLLFSLCLSTASQAGERLEYRISYQGGLTAMARLDICDAVLERSWQSVALGGERAYRAQIRISSEPHKEMESLYPFRYRLTSYFSTDLQRALLFDLHKGGRKVRHEVVRFDWEEGRAERYKRRKRPQAGEAFSDEAAEMFRFLGYAPVDFRRSGRAGPVLSAPVLDRLSLLQVVRSLPLAVGDERRFAVSDGKKVLNYRIRVQARGPLDRDRGSQELFKVRFDAFEAGRWSGQPVHPPLFVWMTADERKVPVRFVVDYALGRFVARLKGSPEGRQTAKISPLAQRSPAR